jgi:hypothetical protein
LCVSIDQLANPARVLPRGLLGGEGGVVLLIAPARLRTAPRENARGIGHPMHPDVDTPTPDQAPDQTSARA